MEFQSVWMKLAFYCSICTPQCVCMIVCDCVISKWHFRLFTHTSALHRLCCCSPPYRTRDHFSKLQDATSIRRLGVTAASCRMLESYMLVIHFVDWILRSALIFVDFSRWILRAPWPLRWTHENWKLDQSQEAHLGLWGRSHFPHCSFRSEKLTAECLGTLCSRFRSFYLMQEVVCHEKGWCDSRTARRPHTVWHGRLMLSVGTPW